MGATDAWPEAGGGCKCWVNPKPFTHYGAVEPGDALEPNPDCPIHFPAGITDPRNLIAEARAKFESAHTEVIRILSVNEQVRMSIPTNLDKDTDMLLISALDAGRGLAAALEATLPTATSSPELFICQMDGLPGSAHDPMEDGDAHGPWIAATLPTGDDDKAELQRVLSKQPFITPDFSATATAILAAGFRRPSEPVTVTDAQVEAAAKAIYCEVRGVAVQEFEWPDHVNADKYRVVARAALEAAAAVTPEPVKCAHEWQNRVAGGSLCQKCNLWQDRRIPSVVGGDRA